jgi:tetratricopeptide (TPR) repeat protein
MSLITHETIKIITLPQSTRVSIDSEMLWNHALAVTSDNDLIQQGRVREAMEQWQGILVMQPENGNAKSNLAWVFATYPEESVRNGTRAVQLAEEALQLSGGRNPLILRTFAAAYAESGRFAEAVGTAQRGLELATKQGNASLANEFQTYILLYRAGTPLRDTSLTSANHSP